MDLPSLEGPALVFAICIGLFMLAVVGIAVVSLFGLLLGGSDARPEPGHPQDHPGWLVADCVVVDSRQTMAKGPGGALLGFGYELVVQFTAIDGSVQTFRGTASSDSPRGRLRVKYDPHQPSRFRVIAG